METEKLTLKKTLWFFVPLALSGIMMSAGAPIVHSGLARLPRPELVLAAYGISFYAAVLVEAPIIMLLPASSPLVRDATSYRLVRNAMLIINIFLTAIMAIVVYHGPTYDFIFLGLMRYPPAVAEAARASLSLLLLWPASIGVRRFCQGILIRLGHPEVVGWSTLTRLLSMVICVYIGVEFFPGLGVLIGAGTLIVGVLVEMAVAMWALHRRFVRKPLPASVPDTPAGAMSYRGFVRFYLPLALTSFAWVLARPLMLSGIARSHMADLSLAAFPVAMGSMQVLTGHLRMIQQVVVALVEDAHSLATVRRFSLWVGGGLTGLLSLVAFTPLAVLYHGGVIGLRSPTLDMANVALGFMVLMPLLTAIQAYNQGLMIRAEDTLGVNMAAFANLGVLVILLNIGVGATTLPGYIIAACVLPAALAFEVFILRRWTQRHIRLLQSPAPRP